jgi:phosphatidylglycerophosphate synthase
MAAELVLGRSVLDHLLDLSTDLSADLASPGEPVVIHAREEEHGELRELALGSNHGDVHFEVGPPRARAAVLRTDRIYDPARLRRGLRRGRSPETAVLWRLDRPETLATVDAELTRRLTYQPLGRYWAFPLADWLAERLCATSIRPNGLTLASAGLMLAAAGMTAAHAGGWVEQLAVVLCLSLALVLDTADGRLARLQGTSSAFGRWLDQVLDELADLALHAAIAWSAFVRDGGPIWLVVGILYASGKYLFLIQSLLGNELEEGQGETALTAQSPEGASRPSHQKDFLEPLARVARYTGHADVRWHLWIALALVGRLDLGLAFYAIYFAARAVGGSVRKGIRYA